MLAMEKITGEHLKTVCQMGKGMRTCAYLTMSGGGFECGKNTSVEAIIRQRLAEGTMKAQGDNCEGREGAVDLMGF